MSDQAQPGEGQNLARRLITMMIHGYAWEVIAEEVMANQEHSVEALLFMTGFIPSFLDEEMWQKIIIQAEAHLNGEEL